MGCLASFASFHTECAEATEVIPISFSVASALSVWTLIVDLTDSGDPQRALCFPGFGVRRCRKSPMPNFFSSCSSWFKAVSSHTRAAVGMCFRNWVGEMPVICLKRLEK